MGSSDHLDRDRPAEQAADADFLFFGGLAEHVESRLRSGAEVDVASFVQQRPDLEAEIIQLVPALIALNQLGRDTSSSEDDLILGVASSKRKQLGEYRILREVGRGGMGVVYEAEQTTLGRRVALKVLPFAAVLDPRRLQRFRNESLAAAQLDHPGIVDVLAVGYEQGVHFYAMRYVEGNNASELIAEMQRERRILDGGSPGHTVTWQTPAASEQQTADGGEERDSPRRSAPSFHDDSTRRNAAQALLSTWRSDEEEMLLRSIVRMGIELAEALDHAHKVGVVHRDVKPSNILIDRRGRPYITDFGLAQLETHEQLTQTGDLVGTLRYMSPEQSSGKSGGVDHRTDIYSLAATLYELLTLHPVVTGGDRHQVLRQISQEEPQALRRLNKDVPADLETIILKALAKDPGDRYASAQEMADDLRRFLDAEPIKATRPSLVQRCVRIARRYPGAVSSALALLVLALLGLSVGLGLLAEQRNAARQAARTADEERIRAEAAVSNLQLERGIQRLESGNALGLLDLVNAEQFATSQHARDDLRFLWSGWMAGHAGWLEHLVGHEAAVTDVAYSCDGKHLATASMDGTVRIWDPQTGLPIDRPIELDDAVLHVAFSPDGRLMAAGTAKVVRLWRVSPLAPCGKPLAIGSGDLRCLAFSPNGELLATCCTPATDLRIWRTDIGELLGDPIPKKDVLSHVAFSPDGKSLAACQEGNQIGLWDLETRRFRLLGTQVGSITRIRFGSQGSMLVTAGKQTKCWDLRAWRQVGKTIPSVRWVREAVPRPKAGQVLTADSDWTTRLWDARTGEPATPPLRHGSQVDAVAFSPGGRIFATATAEGVARLWDSQNGEAVSPPLRHLGAIAAIDFHPHGGQFATASRDGTVRLWNTNVGRRRATIRQRHGVRDIRFTPSGLLAMASHGVHFWDLANAQPLGSPLATAIPTSRLAISNDGRFLSTIADDQVHTYRLPDGERFGDAHQNAAGFHRIAFVPDKNVLLAASKYFDRSIQLLAPGAAPSGSSLVAQLPDDIHALAVSPRGDLVAVGTAESALHLWELSKPPRSRLRIQWAGRVEALAFGPDGRFLAAGSADGAVKLLDVSTRNIVGALGNHKRDVRCVEFSADGRFLASASLDGTVRLWPLRSGMLRHSVRWDLGGPVKNLAASPDGKLLAARSAIHSVEVFGVPVTPLSAREMRLRTWVELGVQDGKQGLSVIAWREWRRLKERLHSLLADSPKQDPYAVLFDSGENALRDWNAELAAAWQRLSNGENDAAREAFGELVRTFEELQRRHPEAVQHYANLATALHGLAEAEVDLKSGRLTSAERNLQRSLGQLERIRQRWPSAAQSQINYGSVLHRLAIARQSKGDNEQAYRLYEQAREYFEGQLQRQSSRRVDCRDWWRCVRDQTLLLTQSDFKDGDDRFRRLLEATVHVSRVVGAGEQLVGETGYYVNMRFAQALLGQGRVREGLKLLEAADNSLNKIAARKNIGSWLSKSTTRWGRYLEDLGWDSMQHGDPQLAVAFLRRARQLHVVSKLDSSRSNSQHEFGRTLTRLGLAWLALNEPSKAVEVLREARDVWREVVVRDAPASSSDARYWWRRCLTSYGELLAESPDIAKRELDFRALLEDSRQVFKQLPNDYDVAFTRATICRVGFELTEKAKAFERARTLLDDAEEILQRLRADASLTRENRADLDRQLKSVEESRRKAHRTNCESRRS